MRLTKRLLALFGLLLLAAALSSCSDLTGPFGDDDSDSDSDSDAAGEGGG
jgi:hypothetical protein